jgi:hypothetical protein
MEERRMRSPVSFPALAAALMFSAILVLFHACTDSARGAVCDAQYLADIDAVQAIAQPSTTITQPLQASPGPPDWLLNPWLWVALLIVSHVVMLIIFVKGLRANAQAQRWHADDEQAIAVNEREAAAVRRLPLLDPEPDPESEIFLTPRRRVS